MGGDVKGPSATKAGKGGRAQATLKMGTAFLVIAVAGTGGSAASMDATATTRADGGDGADATALNAQELMIVCIGGTGGAGRGAGHFGGDGGDVTVLGEGAIEPGPVGAGLPASDDLGDVAQPGRHPGRLRER
jgi:hypothetical protein